MRACEAAETTGAKIHGLLMSTYRNSIAAYLVYFQSTFANILEPLLCVSYFSDFEQEDCDIIQPIFKAIAFAMKRDSLGLEEQEKFCRMYRQLVSDSEEIEADTWMGLVFNSEAVSYLDHGVSIVKGIVEALEAFGKFSSPHLVYEPEVFFEDACKPTATPTNGSHAITFASCVAELMLKVDSLRRILDRRPTSFFDLGNDIRCAPFRNFDETRFVGDSLVEWPRLLFDNPFVAVAKTYMQRLASLFLKFLREDRVNSLQL